MAECRAALPQDREQTHDLWQQVFGDTPQTQDYFYDLCAPQGPLVLVEADRMESMLVLSPVELSNPDGSCYSGAYLYALATNPQSRGKGYAGQLLTYASAWGRQAGLDFLCTVPAQPALFQFFGENGYTPAFFHTRQSIPAPLPGMGEEISPQIYVELREQLLADTPHIVHTTGQIAFEERLNGRLYRLELPHGSGCAVIERWGEHNIVKELLCEPEDRASGAALVSYLCGGSGELRTTCQQGEGSPFGAIRWLVERPQNGGMMPQGYLGLALD